jgi:hypothetical protein
MAADVEQLHSLFLKMVTIETRSLLGDSKLALCIAASVSGRTASAMMGGRSANGAMTGAFGSLLNQLQQAMRAACLRAWTEPTQKEIAERQEFDRKHFPAHRFHFVFDEMRPNPKARSFLKSDHHHLSTDLDLERTLDSVKYC